MNDTANYIIVGGCIAACGYAIYSLLFADRRRICPWWKFWDPKSGFFGGLMFAAMLSITLAFLTRMGVF